jgi:hypothetical protein
VPLLVIAVLAYATRVPVPETAVQSGRSGSPESPEKPQKSV